MGPETNPISPDPAIRKAAVAYLDRVMDCGQAFGCEILCGPIHSAIGVFSGQGPTEDEFKHGVETLRAGRREGPGARHPAGRRVPQPVRDLLPDDRRRHGRGSSGPSIIPYLQDDVRQLPRPHRGEGPGARRSPRARPRRSTSTSRRTTAACPGPGQVDWDSFWSGLKASGYDGYLTIEAFGRALPALAAATRVWRDLFPDAMGLCRDGLAFIKKNIG